MTSDNCDRSSDRRAEYVARVNRVIDHIERNLDSSLPLSVLAEVANFSPYHFHRIFAALVGETLSQFVQRLRLEKAAMMLHTNRSTPIVNIALDCGFSSSATFARAFKEHYGMSASEWRLGDANRICASDRKIGKPLRNLGNAESNLTRYRDPQSNTLTWRYRMRTKNPGISGEIEVGELPEREVVYLRHVGPYGQVDVVPRLFEQLTLWAEARSLVSAETQYICVAHDAPTVTEPSKLRLSVCLTVPSDTAVDGDVGTMKIPGGRFAIGRFELDPSMIGAAWNAVCGEWLPSSGFQPDDRACYERVVQSPREHPLGKIIVEICLPVRPI